MCFSSFRVDVFSLLVNSSRLNTCSVPRALSPIKKTIKRLPFKGRKPQRAVERMGNKRDLWKWGVCVCVWWWCLQTKRLKHLFMTQLDPYTPLLLLKANCCPFPWSRRQKWTLWREWTKGTLDWGPSGWRAEVIYWKTGEFDENPQIEFWNPSPLPHECQPA